MSKVVETLCYFPVIAPENWTKDDLVSLVGKGRRRSSKGKGRDVRIKGTSNPLKIRDKKS